MKTNKNNNSFIVKKKIRFMIIKKRKLSDEKGKFYPRTISEYLETEPLKILIFNDQMLQIKVKRNFN